eukprot:scaffold40900_cov79-Cyclotella_meneghiniana.AAC.1
MKSSLLTALSSLLLLLLEGIAGQELATVAISTFLLELTIQIPPSRSRLLSLGNGSINHDSNNSNGIINSHHTADSANRQLVTVSTDALIQSTAERHLSKVYSEVFRDVSQVLLTVVTTHDDTDEKGECSLVKLQADAKKDKACEKETDNHVFST